MSTYKRGLRKPHIDFVREVTGSNSDVLFEYSTFVLLRVIAPIPKEIAQDARMAFDLSLWPNFKGQLADALASYDPKNLSTQGQLPEETEDPDEPQALWTSVTMPIPVGLFEDKGRDVVSEVMPDIEEAMVRALRRWQTRGLE